MKDAFAQLHQQTYDSLAHEYESRVETYRTVTEHALQPFIHALPQDSKVLDIGCAVGYTTQILREYGKQAEGIDISPAMISFARRRNPGTTFVVGDFLEQPYEYAAYNGVLLYAFMHLFPKDDALKLLEKVVDILKSGGYIFIGTTKSSESSEGFEEKTDYGSTEKRYRKRWTQVELESVFDDLGLKIIHYEDNTDKFGKVWMDYVVQKVR